MINKIPGNMTIEEASDFWDAHSVADYPSHVVQLEYKPEEQIIFVEFAKPDTKASQKARSIGRNISQFVDSRKDYD